jgi:acetate kinase
MRDTLLVVNAGSSSLKFQVYEIGGSALGLFCRGQISGIGGERPRFRVDDRHGKCVLDRSIDSAQMGQLHDAQQVIADWLRTVLDAAPRAVGHRIVHGGAHFTGSVVVDDDILRRLADLESLAPLHQHNNLAPIRVIREQWPDMPQVACFDTAFHRTNSNVVQRFALPESFYENGVLRYGFHGISYEYIAQYLARELPHVAKGRVIVAHLGSGASACAMRGGRSLASTMGFTALDGLPMSTRPGSLDAGVVLWMQGQGMQHDEIEHVLYSESGLKGLSGISGDVRDLLASSAPSAAMALDYFAFRVAESLAGLCVATQGVDAIVFTAGVGENAAPVRAAIIKYLSWLGIELDPALNARSAREISASHSGVRVYVVPTNEGWVIAQQTAELLALAD